MSIRKQQNQTHQVGGAGVKTHAHFDIIQQVWRLFHEAQYKLGIRPGISGSQQLLEFKDGGKGLAARTRT